MKVLVDRVIRIPSPAPGFRFFPLSTSRGRGDHQARTDVFIALDGVIGVVAIRVEFQSNFFDDDLGGMLDLLLLFFLSLNTR